MAKEVTREQAERKKQQAVEVLERVGEPDRADDFDAMSVDEYADRRGFRLTNPKRQRRRKTRMANGTTKTDLQDQIDNAIEALSDAYTPESSREDLAAAVGSALDILNGETDDDSDDDDDIDEGDYQD